MEYKIGIRRYIRAENGRRLLKEVQYACFELAHMIVKITAGIFIRNFDNFILGQTAVENTFSSDTWATGFKVMLQLLFVKHERKQEQSENLNGIFLKSAKRKKKRFGI